MNERPSEPMSKYGTITANHAPNHMITWTQPACRLTSVLTACWAGGPLRSRFLTDFYLGKITDNEINICSNMLHVIHTDKPSEKNYWSRYIGGCRCHIWQGEGRMCAWRKPSLRKCRPKYGNGFRRRCERGYWL